MPWNLGNFYFENKAKNYTLYCHKLFIAYVTHGDCGRDAMDGGFFHTLPATMCFFFVASIFDFVLIFISDLWNGIFFIFPKNTNQEEEVKDEEKIELHEMFQNKIVVCGIPKEILFTKYSIEFTRGKPFISRFIQRCWFALISTAAYMYLCDVKNRYLMMIVGISPEIANVKVRSFFLSLQNATLYNVAIKTKAKVNFKRAIFRKGKELKLHLPVLHWMELINKINVM